MNIETLKKVMAATPNTHTIMLKGSHGLGKTEVVREHTCRVWYHEEKIGETLHKYWYYE